MNDHPEQWKLMGIPDLPLRRTGTAHLPARVANGKREIVPLVEWKTTEAGKLSRSGLHHIQATELF